MNRMRQAAPVRASVEVDVHDCGRVRAASRRQRRLPVRQPPVAELTMRLAPGSTYRNPSEPTGTGGRGGSGAWACSIATLRNAVCRVRRHSSIQL